jgi:hypothetical protein
MMFSLQENSPQMRAATPGKVDAFVIGANTACALLNHSILKTIILPRQARDNRGEKHSKKRDVFFAQALWRAAATQRRSWTCRYTTYYNNVIIIII